MKAQSAQLKQVMSLPPEDSRREPDAYFPTYFLRKNIFRHIGQHVKDLRYRSLCQYRTRRPS